MMTYSVRIGTVNFKSTAQPTLQIPATFQMRIEKEWITVNFNKTDIELTKKGAVLDVTLAYDVDYRVITANPGAEVFISRIDPHR